MQWLALLILTIGVALVQVIYSNVINIFTYYFRIKLIILQIPSVSPVVQDSKSELLNATKSSLNAQSDLMSKEEHETQLIGLISVLVACFSSGFAGVFFEMLVKTGAQPSVVIRNLQLSLFSLVFATSAVIFNDYDAVAKDGFFQGYHSIVFIIIILQVIPFRPE